MGKNLKLRIKVEFVETEAEPSSDRHPEEQVDDAKAAGNAIVLEDLTGIRDRTNKQPRNRTERRRSNSWAFHPLRAFLEYKAKGAGVPVVLVNPAYTSQTCHGCLHIGSRSAKSFSCSHCSCSGDADLNGARVIALLGAAVTQPGGPGPHCMAPAQGY